jgi:hypothetical protein
MADTVFLLQVLKTMLGHPPAAYADLGQYESEVPCLSFILDESEADTE